ncbi:hypothetical protein LX81_00751 [Palleronia aestuarii]|uniref:Uncharacterized protein n=2 Tax=Palleronia aestuarii TaxID=568105 RepID=A0A2W7NHX9_9RHOB|nr:hypothetical protein LX81_00751 [Palleronia aestuarii]
MIRYAPLNAVLTLLLLAAIGAAALSGLWQVAAVAFGIDVALRTGLALLDRGLRAFAGLPLVDYGTGLRRPAGPAGV